MGSSESDDQKKGLTFGWLALGRFSYYKVSLELSIKTQLNAIFYAFAMSINMTKPNIRSSFDNSPLPTNWSAYR